MHFQVTHQCPQCGAPVTLGEEDRFFVCPYCRVRSCIDQKGFFRYLLSPSESSAGKEGLIYIPYWRFKGTLFTCATENGIGHRFMDMSRLALPDGGPGLPLSLGFRTQALPLSLVSADNRGRFLTPGGLKDTMADFDRQFVNGRDNEAIVFREYIGEMISLIYTPIYLKDRALYDAVLDEPIPASLSDDFDLDSLATCRPEKETSFISGLCPHCGWDLEGNAESLALVCRNCDSLWRPHKGRLARIRYGCVEGTDEGDSVLLPFWRIEADINGVDLASYADLVHLANLPRAVQPGWEKKPFAFWTPAFKIRPKIFLRLGKQLSLIQPEVVLSETIDKRPLYPVTLPPGEAVESMKIILAAVLRPGRTWIPQLPGITIQPRQITLTFLPFTDRHHDLYAPLIKVSINKAIMTHAANL